MTTSNVATELRRLVQNLHNERTEHVKAIVAIDQTFQDLGLNASQIKPAIKVQPNSLKKADFSASKRTRKTFEACADMFVLSFIQANPGCTTAQVNDYWITEGRNGKADQTLFKLTKAGQLDRKNIKGHRGSMYYPK